MKNQNRNSHAKWRLIPVLCLIVCLWTVIFRKTDGEPKESGQKSEANVKGTKNSGRAEGTEKNDIQPQKSSERAEEAGKNDGQSHKSGKSEAAGAAEHKQGSAAGAAPDKSEGPEEAEAEEPDLLQPAMADIRVMEAGSLLDISGLDSAAVSSLFYAEPITEQVLSRIQGISYQENEAVSLENLRYLRVLHIGFDGLTHIGELIVNEKLSADVLEIMEKLYNNAYPIEKMVLIDTYGGDDNLSMADNNSSAFNYRVIAGTAKLSKHSLGLAVDINPKYNPYVRTNEAGETIADPSNGAEYADRSLEFEHKINENDLCFQLFAEHGFSWGGHWKSLKDYQHFEKSIN